MTPPPRRLLPAPHSRLHSVEHLQLPSDPTPSLGLQTLSSHAIGTGTLLSVHRTTPAPHRRPILAPKLARVRPGRRPRCTAPGPIKWHPDSHYPLAPPPLLPNRPPVPPFHPAPRSVAGFDRSPAVATSPSSHWCRPPPASPFLSLASRPPQSAHTPSNFGFHPLQVRVHHRPNRAAAAVQQSPAS